MSFSPLIRELIQAFQVLPGVGPRTSQRMALYVLERNRDGGNRLSRVLEEALQAVQYCHSCGLLSEMTLCPICADPHRDLAQLCIVGSPSDLFAFEETGHYRGTYFVLRGSLSPIDGRGPEDIGLPQLERKLAGKVFQEVIIATNPTVEGEATAHYVALLAKNRGIKVSRIALGVPMGCDLEYIDGGTLSHALIGRQVIV